MKVTVVGAKEAIATAEVVRANWARSVAPVSKPGAERRAPVNIFLTVTQ
jgi:hypothetical protein